jgi:flagellar hook-associated protein 1 FlgK
MREEEVAKMGVDSDEEMRQLLMIEKAYAANARVLQVTDQMISELLSIR